MFSQVSVSPQGVSTTHLRADTLQADIPWADSPGADPLPGQTSPWADTTLWADIPLRRHTPLGRHPPWADTPPAGMLGTVNKRAVHILLEYNLVFFFLLHDCVPVVGLFLFSTAIVIPSFIYLNEKEIES